MKVLFESILRKFGVKISRFQASPYEYLVKAPRYQELTVDLLGTDFRVADALSFYFNFREIFYEEIYKFRSATPRPMILDLGSNYGTSIVFFKTIFPEAQIIAVEPDPKIFQLLEWNMNKRKHEDVVLINKAVSESNIPIRFYQEGADGGRMFPIEGCLDVAEIEPVHLDDLITGPVDFLKMDIEGAETEVLCSSDKLNKVSNIFIEYHSFKGVEQSLSSILEKLKTNDFRYYIHKQFCSPRPFIEEKTQIGQDLQLNIFATKGS